MMRTNDLYRSQHNFETSVRVEDALLSTDRARFDRVSAVAFCGIVELTGNVSSYYDKAQAMRIARRVSGVTTVVEALQVIGKEGILHSRSRRRPWSTSVGCDAKSQWTASSRLDPTGS